MLFLGGSLIGQEGRIDWVGLIGWPDVNNATFARNILVKLSMCIGECEGFI
jgi:hypothetical protein